MRGLTGFLLLLCCLASVAGRAVQAQTPVAVELVLAVDTSASVNDAEFALQMNGIAEAFRSPDVIELIGLQEGVAVTLVQWSGWVATERRVPWRLLHDRNSILAFAAEVEASHRQNVGNLTAIGAAIDGALDLLASNGYAGRQLKIDISGDGQNNAGPALNRARLKAEHLQVTVNALAVLTDVPNLDRYFRQHVVTGPRAFVVTSADYRGFAQAMRRKLLRELAPPDLARLAR